MRTASVADLKSHLSRLLKETEKEPVVVTRDGKPVAVLLGVTDQDELERIVLAHSPRFQILLAAARNRVREGKGISHEDFWADVEEAQE